MTADTVFTTWKVRPGSQIHTQHCEGVGRPGCPLSCFAQAILFYEGNVDIAFDSLRADELEHLAFNSLDEVSEPAWQLPMWPAVPKALPKSSPKPRNALSVMCTKHTPPQHGQTCGFVLFQESAVKS